MSIKRNILGIIYEYSGQELKGKVYLMKLLFLLVEEYDVGDINFEPHQYGPFSSEIHNELQKLEDEGFIDVSVIQTPNGFITKYYCLTNKGEEYIKDCEVPGEFKDLLDRFEDRGFHYLLDYIEENYSEYINKGF